MADVLIAESSSAPLNRRDHLLRTFEAYRAELDANNERRERIIITSRSITQLSKKLIFHLHRGATAPTAARAKNLKEGKGKEREIYSQFVRVRDELNEDSGSSYWKWSRQVSSGLEEYIEGLSFLYYLEHRSLISLEDIQKTLSDAETGEHLVIVTPDDYVLGTSDLTGELMRYATNSLSTGDHETPLAVCDFVRSVKTRFDGIPGHMVFKLAKKQEETTRSLEKTERVCYALRLRLIEFADRPDILRQMARRALEDARDSEGDAKADN